MKPNKNRVAIDLLEESYQRFRAGEPIADIVCRHPEDAAELEGSLELIGRIAHARPVPERSPVVAGRARAAFAQAAMQSSASAVPVAPAGLLALTWDSCVQGLSPVSR
jgi:hypothetical protein